MKFAQLTVTALTTFLVLQGPARAQFAVIDMGAIAQTIVQIEKTAAILEQTMNLVTVFSSSFGVTGLLGSLNQANRYPLTNQLSEKMFGSSKIPSVTIPTGFTARAIIQDREVSGTDAEAKLLLRQITGAANAADIAADNLEKMGQRLAENSKTLAQLSSSRNIMQATVTNGLLLKQIHDAIIQNSQATSLLTMTTAQASLHAAEEAAAQRLEREKTGRIFGPW
ncbi:type IV secretion system protein VirB5 [Rhizobium leguminosarum]|uniref:Type IV secretion system protein VirB5 n=1 Tax=Rhizobium laguerreae TaxID=1076926 RepID=A0A6N9ZM80_9HYPH|nr:MULTISPECIES: type IV secretion system protein VirB5 [Rhizobium]MBY5413381.1 type IV secretion system protein VirB5 [Rhizobium leguminosarum]MBY5523491.1 type IV secretion system protein VirB5 [Rhizobium leguminosarum]MBY5551909.1 type IV secretion system protein VirB5 [Rhizobium leguminosarum]MBY5558687.1 type IV secretion system protein VirB5 [Rhizobium leguminosarum]MBY5571602.1 type IV secretion system protein VirB5 [Rhizobium leguminosarum]